MKYQCECTYCGHIWIEQFWMDPTGVEVPCVKCDDKHCRLRSVETQDVFGYNVS